MFIPTFVLNLWFGGIFSFALIGFGAYLAREWYLRGVWVYDPVVDRYLYDPPDLGWNEPTALLAGAFALLAWAILGGLISRGISLLMQAISGSKPAADQAGDRPDSRRDGKIHRLRRPDGSELQVEIYGPDDAPPIVVTHGWGVNSTEFSDLKRLLSDRFRLIAWDLPGMGKSKGPDNKDFRLETFAGHLDAVLGLAEGRPAVVLGHSIGGMTILTYCREHAAALGDKVAGIILVHTTYKNPVRTTKYASIFTALEKPLIVPLLHLTIALWPVAWLMNWMGYLNGSAQKSTKDTGFGGTETPRELDFAARFQTHASPADVARGMFGMLAYDATAVLPSIPVPVLIIPGDRDPVCTPEASEFMSRQIPNARLSPLSPARHMGLLEHHEPFATLVAEFADSCQSSRSHVSRI